MSILCTTAEGVSGTLRIAVTSSIRPGTLTQVFSMDLPAISSVVTSNAVSTGSASVTVFGGSFGVHQHSVASRADGTGCEATEWDTDVELRCRVPSGRGNTLRVAVTAAGRSGTVTEALSFNAPSLARVSSGGANAPASDNAFNVTGASRKVDVRLYLEKGIQTPMARGRST